MHSCITVCILVITFAFPITILFLNTIYTLVLELSSSSTLTSSLFSFSSVCLQISVLLGNFFTLFANSSSSTIFLKFLKSFIPTFKTIVNSAIAIKILNIIIIFSSYSIKKEHINILVYLSATFFTIFIIHLLLLLL